MKQDILKEARKRAEQDMKGLKFASLQEMKRYHVQLINKWARHLYTTDKSRERSL